MQVSLDVNTVVLAFIKGSIFSSQQGTSVHVVEEEKISQDRHFIFSYRQFIISSSHAGGTCHYF